MRKIAGPMVGVGIAVVLALASGLAIAQSGYPDKPIRRGGVLAAERLRQIDAGNLADEHGMDLLDGERHFAVVLRRSILL